MKNTPESALEAVHHILTLTSSTLVTVSRQCGILWTKVDVVGLAWSSLASLTKSPTVIPNPAGILTMPSHTFRSVKKVTVVFPLEKMPHSMFSRHIKKLC